MGNSFGSRWYNSNSSTGQVFVWHNIGQHVDPHSELIAIDLKSCRLGTWKSSHDYTLGISNLLSKVGYRTIFLDTIKLPVPLIGAFRAHHTCTRVFIILSQTILQTGNNTVLPKRSCCQSASSCAPLFADALLIVKDKRCHFRLSDCAAIRSSRLKTESRVFLLCSSIASIVLRNLSCRLFNSSILSSATSWIFAIFCCLV